MSQQTRSAWTETIAAVSAFRPVILWIDDLQWGGLASVHFLDHVLDPAVAPVLADRRRWSPEGSSAGSPSCGPRG
ncbi:MAG: hypothetical protein R3A51_18430 [Nannocystaceae bacterium]